VATLVARSLPPTEIVAAVAEELGRLVSIDGTRILRYEADGTATVIAGWSESVEVPPKLEVGARLALEGESVSTRVFRTGRPARIDNYASSAGPLSEPLRGAGVRSAVGVPIIVEGRLWGVMAAGSTKPEPLPSGMELRLAEFTELVATAIANAESRAELTASRARIVAASDEARRRIERDLHDGAQQRLVSLCLELRAAEGRLPPELSGDLSRVAEDIARVLDDLREISRGIHPAILAEGGLEPGAEDARALHRSRSRSTSEPRRGCRSRSRWRRTTSPKRRSGTRPDTRRPLSYAHPGGASRGVPALDSR
jgi:GAF domain-containing protein